MNILFLTYGKIYNISEHSIYIDLIRAFQTQNNNIYTVSPKYGYEEGLFFADINIQQVFVDVDIVRGGNRLIKKGISILTTQNLFVNAIKKHLSNVKFDLVIYSTPPITLFKAAAFVKKRDNSRTYLLLKDIFPV